MMKMMVVIMKSVLDVHDEELWNLFAMLSNACPTCNNHHRVVSDYLKIFFSSGQLSLLQISMISSNVDVLCQLLCRQVYDSKDEINDDEKNLRDETRYDNFGVGMLCRDSGQYAKILVRGDEPFENAGDIDISLEKCGQQKRLRAFELREACLLHVTPVVSQVMAFTRPLEELAGVRVLLGSHLLPGGLFLGISYHDCIGNFARDVNMKTKVRLQGHRFSYKGTSSIRRESLMCDAGARVEVTFEEATILADDDAYGTTDGFSRRSDINQLKCCKKSLGRRRIDCKSYWSMARAMLALLLFVLSQITCVVGVVPEDEIFALERFYSSTNGDDWSWRRENVFGPKWNFTSDGVNPCATNGKVWQGIKCSRGASLCGGPQICHVISIALSAYNICGTLPPELELMSYLSTFELNGNFLTGTIPEVLGTTTTLTRLDLSVNKLTGTIPSTLANLIFLQYLDLGVNSLSSTIASELGELASLQYLYLGLNFLSGTIPLELGDLVSLKSLIVYVNLLSGTIPPELSHLASLQSLYLYSNVLSGTIPPELGDLASLQSLYLFSNVLSGTIPFELGDLASLQNLAFYSNVLSGTVPPELGYLVFLIYLDLNSNVLSGTIPPELGNLENLLILYLDTNALSGNIPPQLGYIANLTFLDLYSNVLSGTIPFELGDLASLQSLYLHSNAFNGTIPPELGDLSSLQYLVLYSNVLSGSIPPELGNLLSLEELYISSNALSGTIPLEMGIMFNLEYLDLFSNVLTGTIPVELENLRLLYYLDLSNNNLKGSICANISKMVNLQQLYLYSNQLTGSLSKWFENHYFNISLVNIDISNNRFSGSIPTELFLLSDLNTVALTKNCFTGTLPSSMCNAVKVTVFSMDGLGSAEECKHTYMLPFTNVLLGKTMHGSIPACLMLLENMTVLSLSANYLTGTLGELGESLSLLSLTISHNYISGSIPSSILSHAFQSLDLSYNKIHGYVDHYHGNNSLILAVNRLSGGLPNFCAMSFRSLDVLSGNIFGCGISEGSDESSDSYVCGSEELNQSLISLSVLYGVLGLLSLLVFYKSYYSQHDKIYGNSGLLVQNVKCLTEYFNAALTLNESKHSSLISLTKRLCALSNSIWVICGCIIVLSAPIYFLKAMDYGQVNPTYTTHSMVYAWEMTTAYITGELPASLLLLVWFGCVCAFVLLIAMAVNASEHKNIASHSVIKNTRSNETFCMGYVKFSIALFLNLCVVGLMNGLYVYLTLQELDVWIHTLIQICFACIKFLWNFVLVPVIVFSPLPISPYRSWLKLFTNMLNSVFLPCIASLFTSTSCFQGVFVAPPEITSFYQILICDTIVIYSGDINKVVCLHYSYLSVEVVPFVPPFAYNNLCGSVILTSYIPVFIYMYIISILVNAASTYVCCTYVNYSKCPKFIQTVLSGVLWPHHDWCSEAVPLSPYFLSRQLLKVDNILCDILHHAGILLTFGLCCPVLAVTIAVYVSIYVLVLLVVVGRFVKLIDCCHSKVTAGKSTVFAALDLASSNSDVYVNTCMWEVVWMSSIFCAVLCWDMASDRAYWKTVVWIPASAMSLPLMMWLCHVMLNKYYFGVSSRNVDVDVEDQQFFVDVASDRVSSWYRMQSNRQESENVELPKLIFPQPAEANSDVNVIWDMKEDVISSDCEHHSEVTSPLAMPTKTREL